MKQIILAIFTLIVVADFSKAKSLEELNIDLATVNDDNCKRLYERCMNSMCYNKGFGRCACSSMAEFNIPQESHDGLKGLGMMTYLQQNEICTGIISQCPSLKYNIKESYKSLIESDCSSLSVGSFKESVDSAIDNSFFAKYEKFKDCMGNYCSEPGNPDLQFTNCFDHTSIDNAGNSCKFYANTTDELKQLKESFATDVEKIKGTYCKRFDSGEMKTDISGNAKCSVEIAFGYYKPNNISQVSAQDDLQLQETGLRIFKTKKFSMGDVIDCSEAGFGTTARVIDNNAKLQKVMIKTEKLRMAGNIVSFAGGMASGISSIGSGSAFDTTMTALGMATEGVSFGLTTVAQKNNIQMMSDSIVDTSKDNLFCFIDQKPFLQNGMTFQLNWVE